MSKHKLVCEDIWTFSLLWPKYIKEQIYNTMFNIWKWFSPWLFVPVGLGRTSFMVDKEAEISVHHGWEHHARKKWFTSWWTGNREEKQERAQARYIHPKDAFCWVTPLNQALPSTVPHTLKNLFRFWVLWWITLYHPSASNRLFKKSTIAHPEICFAI